MKTERPLHNDYASLLRMAIPISLGSLVQFFVVLTDNFFLARLNEDAINGAGNAGLVYLTLQMLAVGSSAALQITIAKRLGEGRRDLALAFSSNILEKIKSEPIREPFVACVGVQSLQFSFTHQ